MVGLRDTGIIWFRHREVPYVQFVVGGTSLGREREEGPKSLDVVVSCESTVRVVVGSSIV
jgi:hypothetical protein